MAEPNAMIVWLVAGKLHFCEAMVRDPGTAGLKPGHLELPRKVFVDDEAMDAATAKLEALRMEELGITGEDIAETMPPAGPWEA